MNFTNIGTPFSLTFVSVTLKDISAPFITSVQNTEIQPHLLVCTESNLCLQAFVYN